MKPNFSKQNQGSVLMTTLVITGILGVTLASYLSLVGGQNRSIVRSQTWNATIPIVEAGIEEAMMHLNKNCVLSDINPIPPDWDADGWTATNSGYYMTRSLGENSYTVTIITTSPYSESRPAIVCQGSVPTPFASASPNLFFAAVGTEDENSVVTNFVARKVRVETSRSGILAKGMVAEGQINLKGNNISSDSFDSEDPAYSTLSLYDPNKSKANGDIATNSGLTNSLNVGNANVSGHISTGPGGTIAIGSNGKVGDKEWMADSTKTGIQPGYSSDDMNVSFDPVQIPFTGGYSTTAPGGTVTNLVVLSSNTVTTSTSYPTGPGTVYTNTTITKSSTYPSSGTYVGTVQTNLVYDTTVSKPTSGFVGVIATNTASFTSSNAPTSGTYLGTVITNLTAWMTSATMPSGYYSIVTNTTRVTEREYPAAGTYVGSVTTNYKSNGQVRDYSYNEITGYSYRNITGYTYEKITGYSFWRIDKYQYAQITGYDLVNRVFYTNAVVETYDFIFNDGNYQLSTLSGKVLVRSNAVVHITDNVQLTGGTDKIQILPGASLKLYVSAESASIGGQGVVNETGVANNFYYYGLPTNTQLSFGGNADFVGVIYAPQADFTLGGGGTGTYDFVGASVTKTATMNGHYNFHYDEALARKGPSRGYVINSWTEIRLDQTK
jgi:hypothetical protein